ERRGSSRTTIPSQGTAIKYSGPTNLVERRGRWSGNGAESVLDVVDLGLLELAGEVHVDGLRLGEELEDLPAALAVAVAGGLDAAERHVRLGPDRRAVDVGDAGLDVAHRAEGARHVLRVDRRREPVLRAVGDGDGFFERRDFEHGEDGA